MGMFCAIAEERVRGDYATKCRELTVTDIYIYIYVYIQRRDDDASRLLASPHGSAIIYLYYISMPSSAIPITDFGL